MCEKMRRELDNLLPKKAWFTLREVCEFKNIGYKHICNKKFLQPNGGIPDGTIGGKKQWVRETVLDWVLKTDKELQIDG